MAQVFSLRKSKGAANQTQLAGYRPAPQPNIISMASPESILIRFPNWVGDVVMATPVLRALRRTYPDAHLAVLIKKYARQLLDDCPYIDEIIEYDADGEHKSLKGYYRLLYQVRDKEFELGVLLPNSFRAAWEMRFARVKRRVGYARQGRGLLLTDPIPAPRDGRKLKIVNMVDYYLAICAHLGCAELSRTEELFTSTESDRRADEILKKNGVKDSDAIVGLAPGAGYGPAKLYPLDRYARVMNALAEQHGARILLITSPKEIDIAGKICGDLAGRPIRLDGEDVDLSVVKSLIKRSSLMVTNDTGPRHIAVAMDKPVVVVFGPTSTQYTDVNLGKTIIVREEVDCSPCQLKVCPIDHRCMERLQHERVLSAAKELMKRHVLRG